MPVVEKLSPEEQKMADLEKFSRTIFMSCLKKKWAHNVCII